MSRSTCNICSYERFDSYNATLWAIQNPWFREHSSLAGALGGPENISPSSVIPEQPTLGSVGQDARSEPSMNYSDSNDSNPDTDDLGPVTDLHGRKPIFCRVGTCLYWHTDLGQVKRHRGYHFPGTFGYWCPNQTETCPNFNEDFRRRDAVNAHCDRSLPCGIVLRANRGKIQQWGRTPSEQDLVPYDPDFHKPYRGSDGRTGHR